ncbi:hypothetical protein [Marinoscillum sp.]|uniref:hypothetical protein n=1 Tax=Marinoscillum sp. TaxID=2024838 RepID=UPI003BAAD700
MIFDDAFILNVISLIAILAVIFLLIILYTRANHVIDKRWKNNLRGLFQTLLASYVNTNRESETEKIKKRIIKLTKTRERKQILLEEVADLYDNFSGVCSHRAIELYNDLSLYNLSLAKLRSSRWHKKMEGIVELSTMGYKKASDLIVPLLYHQNQDVRRTAKVALVELKKSKALDDIAKLPTEMSDWTSLSIIAILNRNPVKLSKAELERLKLSPSDSMRSLASHLEKHSLIH